MAVGGNGVLGAWGGAPSGRPTGVSWEKQRRKGWEEGSWFANSTQGRFCV